MNRIIGFICNNQHNNSRLSFRLVKCDVQLVTAHAIAFYVNYQFYNLICHAGRRDHNEVIIITFEAPEDKIVLRPPPFLKEAITPYDSELHQTAINSDICCLASTSARRD